MVLEACPPVGPAEVRLWVLVLCEVLPTAAVVEEKAAAMAKSEAIWGVSKVGV